MYESPCILLSMKNAHIRILVVLAIVTLVGIISTQLYWFNKAYEQQDQVFNHNVHVALRNVVQTLCEVNGKSYPATNPIERVSSNYYIVRTNDRIDLANLEYLITAEIREQAIAQAFDYGVYDCQNDEMVFAENVTLGRNEPPTDLPELVNEEYYFAVHFPERLRGILADLDLWKFTTVLTIIVLLFFGYALFLILQQKRLSEVQKDFTSNVTHELKTPLATLSLAVESLATKVEPKHMRYVDIIESEVGQLKRHVENILNGAFMEVTQKIRTESTQLDVLLQSLIQSFEKEYRKSAIEWQLHGHAHKPVCTNRFLLETSVRNLVENAVKYGGKSITFKLSQSEKKSIIEVSDDGIGMAKKETKRIFRKFYRVPESRDQHTVKGFGLGLFIVKKAIKKLRGKITVHASPGVGTTFYISIPNTI